jgi:hypothetical protein
LAFLFEGQSSERLVIGSGANGGDGAIAADGDEHVIEADERTVGLPWASFLPDPFSVTTADAAEDASVIEEVKVVSDGDGSGHVGNPIGHFPCEGGRGFAIG